MKRILLFICIAASVYSSAQNKEYAISKNGIGSLKLGMSLGEIEKLLGRELSITKNYLDTLNGSYEDTAKAIYKKISVQLEFHRSYNVPNKSYMRLIGIRSSSSLCKTASGIGIGSDKLKIISDYDSLHIKIQPGYVNYFDTETGKGKNTLSILDDGASFLDGTNEYTMVFYLLNKKVISFELKANLRDEM